MKKNKKILKKIITIILAASVVIGSLNCNVAIASTAATDKQARQAYARELWNGTLSENYFGDQAEYALFDINNDGVRELFATSDEGYHMGVYGYIDGEVKFITGCFSGYYAIYPAKHMYFYDTAHSGSYFQEYQVYDGKTMRTVAERDGEDYVVNNEVKIKYKYNINGKRVSKLRYNKYVKALTKNAKKRTIKKWIKVNKSNIKKLAK